MNRALREEVAFRDRKSCGRLKLGILESPSRNSLGVILVMSLWFILPVYSEFFNFTHRVSVDSNFLFLSL